VTAVGAVPVLHLYGQPAAMDAVNAIAERRGLLVIDDAAQAQGATYGGKMPGALAHAAAYSFYPGKNLGALGDAGAVVTNDARIAEQVRLLRNYGSRVKYENEILGFNSRLDPLQAAFLSAKLPYLAPWNERRRRVAQQYLDGLRGVPELVLPRVAPGAEPVWHLFVVRHPRRDALQAFLAERGVATLIHYPIPPHQSAAYAAAEWTRAPLPIAEELAATVLSLPIGPHLGADDVRHVIESVRDFH
jgi:dTDP-4-amino-4,6-dideoxygalactose transaminase